MNRKLLNDREKILMMLKERIKKKKEKIVFQIQMKKFPDCNFNWCIIEVIDPEDPLGKE